MSQSQLTTARLRKLRCVAMLIIGVTCSSSNSHAQPPVTALAMSPDDESLVAGSQSGIEVVSWPAIDTRQKRIVDIAQIHDLKFSPNGKQLLIVGGAASEYGEWKLVSWPDLEVIATKIAHDDTIQSAAWLSDKLFVTGAADNDLIEWRIAKGNVEKASLIEGHSRRVLCVESINMPGDVPRLLVSAGVDQVLRVWHLEDGIAAAKPLHNLDNHTGAVCDLIARPGDHAIPYLASTSVDKTVRFWQPSIGRLVRFARLPVEPTSLAWNRDGQRIAVGCTDGKLRIIHPNNVEIEQTLDAVEGWVFEVAASADGSFAVGGTAGVIKRVIPAARQ
jgi:WD40 repeat protein